MLNLSLRMILISTMVGIILVGCQKNKQSSDEFLVREWKVSLSPAYLVPGNVTRTDHAYSLIYLMDNNKLYFDLYFDALITTSETPSHLTIYAGTALDNASAPFISLGPIHFDNKKAKGELQITQAQADSLKSNAPFYLVIGSNNSPNGFVRGQIDKTIIAAVDVDLQATNITPSPNTTAMGKATIRAFSDNTILSNVSVANLPASDVLTTTGIYKTTSNELLFTLVASPTNYNKSISQSSTAANINAIQKDPLYVLVKSANYPSGLLKGTIR